MPQGPVIRATFFFNLSHTLLHCKLKHVVRITMFVTIKIQYRKLRQHVVQSRLEFYFLQQILVLLLILPLKLRVSYQIWIQSLCLAVVKRCNAANKNKNIGAVTLWRKVINLHFPPIKTCRAIIVFGKPLLSLQNKQEKGKSRGKNVAKYNFSRKWLPEVEVELRRNAESY